MSSPPLSGSIFPSQTVAVIPQGGQSPLRGVIVQNSASIVPQRLPLVVGIFDNSLGQATFYDEANMGPYLIKNPDGTFTGTSDRNAATAGSATST